MLTQATDTTSGTETRRILNHYNDSGDTPSWINTSTNAGSTWTWQRNVAGIDGNLVALQDQAGTPQIQLTNPHGDIVATVIDDTTLATTTSGYFEPTEYGAPEPRTPPPPPATDGSAPNNAPTTTAPASPSWASDSGLEQQWNGQRR